MSLALKACLPAPGSLERASAIGLLKYPGHALPSRREVNVVSVIIDAAFAMLSPMRHMSIMWS